MLRLNRWIQNLFIAIIMSTSLTALFRSTPYAMMKFEVYNIPILLLVMLILTLFIAEDVRNCFKKVFRYEKRDNKRAIWQVGVGMIFYFVQVGVVEVFFPSWMEAELGGMPLYLVITFMNAFLLTVIYEEIFYVDKIEEKTSSIK